MRQLMEHKMERNLRKW